MRSESIEIRPHMDRIRLVVRDIDGRTVASLLLDYEETLELIDELDTAAANARTFGDAA